MRAKTFSRFLRILSSVVLFFFMWTFGSVWEAVAFAATSQKADAKGQKTDVGRPDRMGAQKPGERFEKALEAIRENVSKAGEKADKGEDNAKERENIKVKRAEIESADIEFKKEFAATEKRLKDANLRKEILDRHAKFVKHYEDNLKELKTNLDDVEQAKTNSDRKAKIEKARLHLEKVKASSKYQKLDPNNLPFKARKVGKKVEPRLKKEDFERDFPKQKSPIKNKMAGIRSLHDRLANVQKQKPILLAFNEFASDIPLQLPRTVVGEASLELVERGWGEGALAVADSAPFLLAQSTGQPSADDLAETPDVQFTEAIRAKAQELGGKPLKIYEWVRNNIEYAPTYGSIQGADMCLQSKICNDIDTASLLIALLRVSGVYSHYEYSTIEIPIEQAMNWVGGVTDPKMVGTILATNGIPSKMLVTGGTYRAVQLEHVYVRAFIDYIPSRGAVHKQGDTWIPLDASYKQYEYKRGMDLYAVMGIKGEKYLQDYITDTSSLTLPPELQSVFPAYTISPYQYYSKKLFDYIDTNSPAATCQDVFGADTIDASRTIAKKEYPYLLGSLPYNLIAMGETYSSIPDYLRHGVSFSVQNAASLDASLTYATTLPEIAGKRITISYVPATMADDALVNQYGALLSVPPYLLNVKVVLKINGVTMATGNPVGLGQEQAFNMTFTMPNLGAEFVTNNVTTGDYSAIAIFSQKVPVKQAGDNMETLINNIGSSDIDDLLGQMLYNVGISYFHHLNFEEELYAKNFQIIVVKGLSEAMITSHAVTNSLFGVPYNISEGGIGIDVDKNEYSPFSCDGNQNRARDFLIVSGLGSSAWEDRVLQAFYDIPSVSAARLLRFASQQGMPVYTIDSGNISTTLTQIQVSSEVSDVIRNSVNAGKKVIVSKTGVQYEGWSGIGYIVLDPTTGAAGYMISSGTAGGNTTRQPTRSVRNGSQYFWGDGSALRTIVGRVMVVINALEQLDTPYKSAGQDPTGFDCSGFIHYIFTSVYGNNILGGERLSASGQHQYLLDNDMIHPYEDKLDGDILWSDNYGHTGIYYGKLYQGEIVVDDTVIHATSSHFRNGDSLKKVVITYTNHPAFTGAGGIMTDIGRPVPIFINGGE